MKYIDAGTIAVKFEGEALTPHLFVARSLVEADYKQTFADRDSRSVMLKTTFIQRGLGAKCYA